jgi:hypothetical protein
MRNKSRIPEGASNFNSLVGVCSNPILKPQAAEIVKKRGEISLPGLAFPDPGGRAAKRSARPQEIARAVA